MQRITLERYQIVFYALAIGAGLVVGALTSGFNRVFESLLWPVLALLLYATFVQVPLLHLKQAFSDRRFALANLVGNFVLVPLMVWGLIQFLPDDPLLRLGVLLVLLVPCTDWFITFTQLGKGCSARAIAISPINLGLQLLLLPFYLWLMLPQSFSIEVEWHALQGAVLVILVPLILALVSEKWIERKAERAQYREMLAWWPVPLLALVVFLIAASQAQAAWLAAQSLLAVIPVYIAFLISAALLAKLMSHALKFDAEHGRTLAFSFGTRNSFVVLPIALSLPQGAEIVTLVIVVQSLVELIGMVFYLWWLPQKLFK
ncbi:MAG: arsenic resistance protein [Thiomicrospira sp.]|uniref:arsenic resistance protein n=1 Tax=Thiomicrospira sp. TaxID=935 RepID=UPI001A04CE4B|nr:arsenic resistance protein [Thiomicrospira sp.]MBE0492786.1 arsenic resistance protein [Thiomicrospira sp.]